MNLIELNNWGAIRFNPKNNWIGKVIDPKNTTGFEEFKTPEDGARAQLKLWKNFIASGSNTIRQVIYKYAPPTENDTENYIYQIVKNSGIGQDEKLTTVDANKLLAIAHAQGEFETGEKLDYNVYKSAWNNLSGNSSSFTGIVTVLLLLIFFVYLAK